METDYTFPLAEKVKAFLADPSAFVAAAPVAATTTAASAAAAAAPAKVGAKEESEESGEDMGFGLWLITKKQPSQPALFVKQRNKGLLLKVWTLDFVHTEVMVLYARH